MDIRAFRLTAAPEDFYEDPYRYYAALREQDPVHELEPGSYFISRYEDVAGVYRHAGASSDKKVEFKPKFGDSPLYEHHTTSLVFNDPPLHTRVGGGGGGGGGGGRRPPPAGGGGRGV
jgi:cytochrome P450